MTAEQTHLDSAPPMNAVPLNVASPVNFAMQPITVGLPFPRGVITDPSRLRLTDPIGKLTSFGTKTLAQWVDGSIKWLLLDFIADGQAAQQQPWQLTLGDAISVAGDRSQFVRCDGRHFECDTNVIQVRVARLRGRPVMQINKNGHEVIDASFTRVTLTDSKGRIWDACVRLTELEHSGPVRATVRIEGDFGRCKPCRFVARVCVFHGTGLVRLRLTLHNPRRARHRGGLWDLGDPGSFHFQDFSLAIKLRGHESRVRYSEEPGRPLVAANGSPFEIYQDSSGGVNWQSRNHVNRHGKVPCSFRGYRVRADGQELMGLRANPIVRLVDATSAVTVAVPEFWQQFPKALDVSDGVLRVRLFPQQFADLFELQGGEQKTHTVWLHFGAADAPEDVLNWVHQPAIVKATPDWYAASGTFPDFALDRANTDDRFEEYLGPIIDGPTSLFARREVIDEFGWRNYGDIYADHENAYYDGPKPVISHYNNQFDSVFGLILQFVRTGDSRWRDLFEPLARHVIDIDIYHTEQDHAAYRGGLFWMTDHYLDAATSTHRTYSRSNRRRGTAYGGGPGNSHNFTTGLLYYHYLTGDPLARDAVLSLADWVQRMDDGRLNILSLVDRGPTGLASATTFSHYHGPGRGAGLSINSQLDAWQLSWNVAYREKAEQLICRCIHPKDDIAALDLLNAELMWSYTVFLVALARFLALKAECGEIDSMYAYARAALLHYADWMADHERPYFDQRERMEFPTETWAAQEFRKANVLRLAAAHVDEPLASRYLRRATELADRAWNDLLAFETRHLARAIAILLTEGTRDLFFRRHVSTQAPRPAEHRCFPGPQSFTTQRARVKSLLRSPRELAVALSKAIWQTAPKRDC